MLSRAIEQLCKNGRRWLYVMVDGSPMIHCHQLALTKPIRLRVAPLHEEINMIRSITGLLYPIIAKEFAWSQGYTTTKAQQ